MGQLCDSSLLRGIILQYIFYRIVGLDTEAKLS